MVLLTARAVGRDALPEYAYRNSPKKSTQHQLFACLTLKAFFKTDNRGIVAILEDPPARCVVIDRSMDCCGRSKG